MQQSNPVAVSKLRRGVLLLIIDILLIFSEPFFLLFLFWSNFIYGNQPFEATLIGAFFWLALFALFIVMLVAPLIITFKAARSLNFGFRSLLSRGWGLIGAAGGWLLAIIAILFWPVGEEGILHFFSLLIDPLEFLAVVFVVDVAFVLIGIGLFKVGLSYNNKLLKIGGIVTAIPLISLIGLIPLKSLIGLIISYVGLGRGAIKQGKPGGANEDGPHTP